MKLLGIWQQEDITGDIMIRTFYISDKKTPKHIIGVQCIGSCRLDYSQIKRFEGESKSGFRVPRGYCWKYHKGLKCVGCNVKHTCPLCQKTHQIINCHNFRNFNGKPVAANPTPPNSSKGKPTWVLLEGYNFQKRMFLIDGFKYGFHLFSVGQSRSSESPNLLSTPQWPQVVHQKLAKELETHRLAGPFDTPSFPVFRVSPMGIVPKKTPKEFRLIHHLSYPMSKSVNDGISHEHSSVQYDNIDHVITKIKQSGVGSYLAKTEC